MPKPMPIASGLRRNPGPDSHICARSARRSLKKSIFCTRPAAYRPSRSGYRDDAGEAHAAALDAEWNKISKSSV
jgi:hypothetical protein